MVFNQGLLSLMLLGICFIGLHHGAKVICRHIRSRHIRLMEGRMELSVGYARKKHWCTRLLFLLWNVEFAWTMGLLLFLYAYVSIANFTALFADGLVGYVIAHF